MTLYEIIFLIFFIIMVSIIFVGISKNILTEYGIGLLIGILVFGIIGYNVLMNLAVWEALKNIESSP
jgi:hypothetical protein